MTCKLTETLFWIACVSLLNSVSLAGAEDLTMGAGNWSLRFYSEYELVHTEWTWTQFVNLGYCFPGAKSCCD